MSKSAEQGFALSQATLGEMYLQGVGVPKNKQEAIKCYKLATDQGHSKASDGFGD